MTNKTIPQWIDDPASDEKTIQQEAIRGLPRWVNALKTSPAPVEVFAEIFKKIGQRAHVQREDDT